MPYRLHLLPFPPRVREPAYLARNPLGTIPLMIDGPTRMTGSAAIIQYLAVTYGPTDLMVAPAESEYGLWLNWLHFGEATLTFPQTLVLRYRMLEPPQRRLPQAADDYAQWFHSRLRHVERALQDRDWLVGGRFTVADISVGYALLLAKSLKIDAGFPSAVAAYWERLKARDAFGRAKAKQQT